jgi:hypothetical protein
LNPLAERTCFSQVANEKKAAAERARMAPILAARAAHGPGSSGAVKRPQRFP